MSGLYTLLRGFVAILGFTLLLGILWFSGSPGGGAFIIPGVLMGFSSLAAAFVPQRKLSSGATRRTLVALCVVGIGAGLVLVAKDLGVSSSIEWDVVAITLLHIATLATMAVIALRRPPENR
jgi:hypothetical protein